jgi:hypothetical protein
MTLYEIELQTFEEANINKNWKNVMQIEYNALIKNKIGELVLPPNNCKIINCHWISKIKYDPQGNIDKYKARLVAKGFSQ